MVCEHVQLLLIQWCLGVPFVSFSSCNRREYIWDIWERWVTSTYVSYSTVCPVCVCSLLFLFLFLCALFTFVMVTAFFVNPPFIEWIHLMTCKHTYLCVARRQQLVLKFAVSVLLLNDSYTLRFPTQQILPAKWSTNTVLKLQLVCAVSFEQFQKENSVCNFSFFYKAKITSLFWICVSSLSFSSLYCSTSISPLAWGHGYSCRSYSFIWYTSSSAS